jgi:hypothetical protein
LALHTSGREFLSWPTARLSDGEGGRIETVLNKTGFKSKRKASNQYFGAKLRDAVETYEEKNWATPNTMDHLKLRSEEALRKQATTTRKGRASPSNLREQVDPRSVEIYEETKWIECKESSTDCKEKAWPTASSRDWKDTIGMSKTRKDRKGLGRIDQLARAVYHNHGLQDRDKSSTNGKSQESWATPTHQDSRIGPNNIGGSKHRRERGSEALADQAIKPSPKATGKLNPNWVEQMMGLPVGWTQLPTEWID